jgi:uncharacterized protein
MMQRETPEDSMDYPFWIAVGDIHEDVSNIGRIPNLHKAQALLVSGDITNRGQRDRAERILSRMAEANPRILAQIGNMDGTEVEALLDERGWNVHARTTDLGHGVGLLAVGYSTPTPFGTPSEVSDEQIAEWLERSVEGEDTYDHLLLMVHTPPHGTATDRLSGGQSVGSRAVRRFIEERQPEVCVTGHIHEARSVDTIGRTTVVNPGMLPEGGYVLIRLTAAGLEAELKMVGGRG